MDYYQKNTEDVLQSIQATENGLTQEEVKLRLERDGYNEIKDKEKVPVWKLFLETFKDPMVIVLLIAAGVQVILGEVVESLLFYSY